MKTKNITLIILTVLLNSTTTQSFGNNTPDSFPRSSFGVAPTNPLFPSSDDLSIPPLVRTPGQIYIEQYKMENENSRVPASVAPHVATSRAPHSGVQEVSLIAGDLGFFPKTVFVYPETKVKIYLTSTSSNTLCLILDDFQIRKQIKNKEVEEITFTPQKPGQFRFYCPVNGAAGTLIVRDFSPEQINAQRQLANE